MFFLLILLLIYKKLPNFFKDEKSIKTVEKIPPLNKKTCLIMKKMSLYYTTHPEKNLKDVCVHNYYKLREINTYPQTILFDIDCFRKKTAKKAGSSI